MDWIYVLVGFITFWTIALGLFVQCILFPVIDGLRGVLHKLGFYEWVRFAVYRHTLPTHFLREYYIYMEDFPKYRRQIIKYRYRNIKLASREKTDDI